MAATGARYGRLDAAGLEQLESRAVYHAAPELDARACAGSRATVVGGNSAGQGDLFLTCARSFVTIVIRGSDLSVRMSRYLADRIEADTRGDVRAGSTKRVRSVHGYMAFDRHA